MNALVKSNSYLFLIIILLLSSKAAAQNLYLEVIGETDSISSILKNYSNVKKHNDAIALKQTLNNLQASLYKDGYINHRILRKTKTNDSTWTYHFKLNTRFKHITIHHKSHTLPIKLLQQFTKTIGESNFTIPFQNTETTLEALQLDIANNGFPFATLNLENISTKSADTLQADLKISHTDTRRQLDAIVIKGYTNFPKSYLKRYLKIKPANHFNIKTIKKKLEGLNTIRFARQIKDPEVLFSPDSTSLYIYLEKTPSNSFDGYLGFSTNETNNKLEFNGYVKLDLHNNFNFGESFNLNYKSTESEQKNFDITLNLPYLFSTPLGTELQLNILKQDSTFTTVKQSAKLFYQIDTKSRIFLGLENYSSNSLLDTPVFSTTDDYKSNFYTLKYTFENRNPTDKLFPIQTYASLEGGIGQRTRDNRSENQTKINLKAFHTIDFNRQNSFYIQASGALLNTNKPLENELYRFGGIQSMRGFAEESLLATAFITINTEYRYRLSNTIYAHSIIDYATLDNTVTNQKNNLYGFGIGFGLLTRAGLLKLNYANGKTESQKFQFSNSNIHLSLSSYF